MNAKQLKALPTQKHTVTAEIGTPEHRAAMMTLKLLRVTEGGTTYEFSDWGIRKLWNAYQNILNSINS